MKRISVPPTLQLFEGFAAVEDAGLHVARTVAHGVSRHPREDTAGTIAAIPLRLVPKEIPRMNPYPRPPSLRILKVIARPPEMRRVVPDAGIQPRLYVERWRLAGMQGEAVGGQ